jgi:hypothetical protein
MHWLQENPHVTVDAHHQSNTTTTVWSTIHGDPLLGPLQLDEVVNTKQYLQFLNHASEIHVD